MSAEAPTPGGPAARSGVIGTARQLLLRLSPVGRFLLRWGLRLLGPALLAYIVWSKWSDLAQIGEILRHINWPPLLLSIALVFPFVLLKGWRWQVILDDLGQHVPWPRLVLYYALGIFMGAAMPGQAGDFLKAWYLKDEGCDLGAALLSTVIDRIFDMLIMGLLALSGLYLLWRYFPGMTLVLLLVGMVAAIVFVLSVLLSRRWRDWLIDRVLRYLIPAAVRRALGERGVRSYLDRFFLSWRNLGLGTAISLISFSTTFFRLWLLIPALGKSLPVAIFVPTMALMALGSLLSVAGLGAREAVLLAILTAAGIGWSTSEVLSLSLLILALSIENLVLGLPLYLLRPLGNKR